MLNKPAVNIWLDNRRPKKDGTFPVKVRVTHLRNRYYYPTNINLTEEAFKVAMSTKPGVKLKETHLKLNELERQAVAAVDHIAEELHTEFTIGLFEKLLHLNSDNENDVYKRFAKKVAVLNGRGQVKTAEGYETCVAALKKYTKRDELSFPEIDKKFLEEFEEYMLGEHRTLTTVGIYCRYLRAIYREAIEDKVVNYELYPFGVNRYQIPQPANNKRALEEKDLIKILKYKPEEGTWEDYAKDMWMFSLLCQGMNMKDIASIRYKNLFDGKLVFTREKTKRSKRNDQKSIVVYLGKDAQKIIKKWGNEDKSPDQLVFSICSDENTPLRNMRLLAQQIKMTNKYMREIATTLKIKQDFTFYAARHSFATVLKRQGRSTEEIQEFLGHASKKTTELYLGSFSDNHKRDVMRDFVKGLKKVPTRAVSSP